MPTHIESRKSLIWACSVAGIIVIASSCSKVAAPSVDGIDKIAHFLFFGLMATHLHRSGITGHKLWLGILLCSLFGFLDEVHQSFTPGRTVSITDWTADTLGASLAITLHDHFRPYRRLLETSLFRLK